MAGGKKPVGQVEREYRRRLGKAIIELRAIGTPVDGPDMSQATLAERLERSEAAVSRWETGKVTPSAFDLVEIARIFELPDDALSVLVRPPERSVSPVRRLLEERVAAGARRGLSRPGQTRGAA